MLAGNLLNKSMGDKGKRLTRFIALSVQGPQGQLSGTGNILILLKVRQRDGGNNGTIESKKTKTGRRMPKKKKTDRVLKNSRGIGEGR